VNSRQEFTLRGFTLMEVMLALALSSLVLMAVGTAIDIHLRVLDSGRTKVEEAQLARAILRQIADDLRSTVRYEPDDSGESSPDMLDPDVSDPDDPDPIAPDPSAPDPNAPDPNAPDPDETDPIDLAESDAPQMTPGLYGNLYQLQLDTSRLPRPDQFDGMATVSDGLEGQIAGPISDIKTVTYYMNDQQTAQATSTSEPAPGSAGLVRREQDRATALWASDGMTLDPSDSLLEPLAPEVAAIEFLYHDGLEWIEEWDSALQGDLPKLVQIAVWIIPVNRRGDETAELTEAGYMVYRLTVHLPMAGEGSK